MQDLLFPHSETRGTSLESFFFEMLVHTQQRARETRGWTTLSFAERERVDEGASLPDREARRGLFLDGGRLRGSGIAHAALQAKP